MRRPAARKWARELLERLKLDDKARPLRSRPAARARAAARHRPRARHEAVVPAPRRAGRRPERAGERRARRVADADPGRLLVRAVVIEHDMRADHAALRADPGARLRQDDQHRDAGRGAKRSRGPDGVPRTEGGRCCTIDDLRVNYGRVPALHGISLHVDEGEVVAMVGPNGAGKTTTLSAIFGLVAPAGGSIVFEGESLVGSSPEKILRRGPRARPGGTPHLRHADRRREPPARHDRTQATETRPPPTSRERTRALPGAEVVLRRARQARSRAASSSSWRSRGRCSRARGCCCSTSRRSASRRS